jgi:hypothetical protein
MQLRIIKAVVNALDTVGISAWLFGGWGLDARIGRITREHGDVEFWVERTDAGRSKAVLMTTLRNPATRPANRHTNSGPCTVTSLPGSKASSR